MDLQVPILNFEDSRNFEQRILQGVEEREYAAMERAGSALASSLIEDLKCLSPYPKQLDVLVLGGKGHNAGDAFIALEELSHFFPVGNVDIILACERDEMRPLALRALMSLSCPVSYIRDPEDILLKEHAYDLCLDGLLGLGGSGIVREPVRTILQSVSNNESIRFRAAVDVPSGLTEESADIVFEADATYMCGIPKKVLFEDFAAPYRGRLRYLDLGFYDEAEISGDVSDELLNANILEPLNKLRKACSDKRTYGHLVVFAGSYCMPGALLMALKGALRSGVGLVTAMAPKRAIEMLGHAVPEVMWIPLDVHRDNTLNVRKSFSQIRKALDKATVFMAGPGMRMDSEMKEIMRGVLMEFPLPVVLDASALQKEVCDILPERAAESGTVLMTPHMGELLRIMGRDDRVTPEEVKAYARKSNAVIYVKGSVGYITDGNRIFYMPYGSPVLARGGSGDILAGLCAGLYATQDELPLTTLSQSVLWHALASQLLVKERGERAVRTTDLLEYITPVLRG
jgi:NAD(P)H-hydrate epimerase